MRKTILRDCHDAETSGHPGTQRTMERIQRRFYWKNWRGDVVDYVKVCAVCQGAKPLLRATRGPLRPLPIPRKPFEGLSMDMITDLPPVTYKGGWYDSILVVVDRFTKWAIFIPCRKGLTSEGLAELFTDRVYRQFGLPESIVSDRGSIFTSKWWTSFCEQIRTRRKLSVAYHPQTDGQTERLNQVIEQYLRSYLTKDQTVWVNYLALAESTWNTSLHSGTRHTPAYLLMGYTPRHPFMDVRRVETTVIPEALDRVRAMHDAREQARDHLERAQQRMQKLADGRADFVKYEEGQWVLLKTRNLKLKLQCKKLGQKFIGPWQIERVMTSGNAVRLALPPSTRVHPVFNVCDLRPFHSEPGVTPSPPSDDPFVEKETGEITDIIGHKGKGARRKWKVRWDTGEETWEPRWSFIQKEMLQEYEAKAKAAKVPELAE